MSQNESYHVNESLRNDLRLRKILAELPEFASRYFYANEFSLSARTRVAYAYDLRTFFRYIITKNPSLQYMQVRDITIAHLEQLSVHDIESYLSYLKCYHPDEQEHRTIHNTPTGIARKLSCLRSFFDYYTGIGEMKRNPAARVSTPKIHTKEIIQLDPDEVEILLSGIENGSDKIGSDKISKHQKKYLDKTRLRDLAITTLLLGTGIRISECVGLDIQDVNFKDNSIKITRKGGNEQIVFFNNEVQYVLEDYLHEQRLNLIPEKGSEDALFLSLKNNRISVDAIEKMIVKYARMYVPHKRITPHDVSGYKDTWSKSTDGNYYSGGAFHITFNSYYGYDMRDQIDTVDISTPAGVKVHKKDNKTYSDFDVYISEKQYNDWSVTGKDIPITVKTSLRAWWGCAMYESKDTSLQPIGFITWTGTGGTYSVSKTITLHIPKDPTKSSKPVSVEVIKKDSLTGEALAGCDFTVYEYQPSTGNYVAKGKLGWDTTNKKYSSDANASLKEALKTNFQENGNQGKFKIVETSVPAGYTSSSAWSQVFSVSATDTSSTAKFSYNVTNDPTRILIKKVDEEGKSITGAHLEIYDSDNKKVAEFDSSADGNEIDRLVVGKTYILKETSVPPGYVKADNVSFLVQDTKEIQTVTMTDKWTKTEFAKISLADKKTVVPGASLELRKAKDIADSVVTTITGKKVQWASGEDPEVFYGIQPGVYWLVETKSPSGYALSDPVQVTIEENLTNTVTMYDLPYTDLTVIKKIRADHINFANGNPTFVITVKGNDLLGNSHEYSEFYEFTKEYVQQQTESDGYVSVKYTWKGIPAGNAYEVTENDVNRYYLSQVTSADENVSIERLQESAYGVRPEDTFRVIADLQSRLTGTTITFENEKYTWGDWSHNAIVKNTIQIIQSR